jgi:hypothetical protein
MAFSARLLGSRPSVLFGKDRLRLAALGPDHRPRTTFGRAGGSLERVIVQDLLATAPPENQGERS